MFEREVSYAAAYTHLEPSRDREILRALRWLAEQQQTVAGEILVLAPGMSNLENSEVITQYRRSLRCMSEATFKKKGYEWRGGPAMALWPTARGIAMLDDCDRTKALAVVPWLLRDVEPWRRARRPIDLLGAAPTAQSPSINDPIVRAAIRSLTMSVNLSTGLSHPSDKAHAVETFKVLKKAGHDWDPDDVHAWALANGWHNRGADDLRKYADGIRKGSSFRTTRYGLNNDVLKHWQELANEDA